MSATSYNLMTKSQEITVAALTVLGGSLSLLGSTAIIYNIISKKKFKHDSYHRLLLGTCTFDVISSVGWLMQMFAVPKDTSARYLAIGNVASCTASGFLAQCSIAYMIYNGCLTIYFLATIRYSLDEAQVLRMEKTMHAISIIWGLGCAIVPLPLQLYNENAVGPGCWLNQYPNDCLEMSSVECIRGLASAELVGYAIAAFPAAVSLLAVLVSNLLVYRTVRTKELATQRVSRRFSETFSNEQQRKRTKSIASQASWYVVVFINSVLWQTTLRMLGIFNVVTRENESRWTILIAMTQFFSSSAGFGFLLVFVRPRYIRFRERDELTRWCAFIAALSFDNSKRQQQRPASSTWYLKSGRSLNNNPSNAYLNDNRRPSNIRSFGSFAVSASSGFSDDLQDDFQSAVEPTLKSAPYLKDTRSPTSNVEGLVA